MKNTVTNIRIWIANVLVKLAHKVRPKIMTEFMKSLEDELIYGNGMTRIDPKNMFK